MTSQNPYKRNKEQERRRKRAEDYLKPTIKQNQIYPLINGQVRTSEPGEVTLLPRNHHLERADPEMEDVRLNTVGTYLFLISRNPN